MNGIPDPGRASNAIGIVAREASSPFDALRHLTSEGREFWSARDLMPLLGYEKWERFADAIGRARVSGMNSGHNMSRHMAAAAKMVSPGSGKNLGGRPGEDYHLSRLACYLVAMNGDPRKPEVAAAQTYFAVRTREAETREVAAPAIPRTYAEALRAAADEHERAEAAEAKVTELEPKAEFYDELMDTDGTYSMGAVANMLHWGRNVMFRELRRSGVLQGNNLPYQRYAHHFKVVPGTFVNRDGETIPTATTKVLPSGIDFLRKRLDRSPVVAG